MKTNHLNLLSLEMGTLIYRGIAYGLILVTWGMAISGCETVPKRYLATKSLPIEVRPAEPDWDINVELDLREDIHIALENNSNEAVHLLWGESAYIDVNQQSHALVPVDGIQMTPSQKSIVAPNTDYSIRLKPLVAAKINHSDPLLPQLKKSQPWYWPFSSKQIVRPRIGEEIVSQYPLKGKRVGLFIVLERNGVKRQLLAHYELVEDIGV